MVNEYTAEDLHKAADAWESTVQNVPAEVKELGERAVTGWALNFLVDAALLYMLGGVELSGDFE
jgi:hypothetical protein